MLTIQAEIIVLVGVQLFTSFCSKCFVSDVDKIHISGTTEGGCFSISPDDVFAPGKGP